MKHTEAYVFALGKEHSLKKGFTKDFELVTASTIVFKKPRQGVIDRAIHVALTDDFENYEPREKLQKMIFLCFLHELLHGICEIENEKLVDKIADDFRKKVYT